MGRIASMLRPGVMVALVAAILLSGCKSARPDQPSQAPATRSASASDSSNIDPCATRLHDLCGPLLLYYSINHRLPPTLAELQKMAGFEQQVKLTCPISDKPYAYNPVGVGIQGQDARVIIYDSGKTHAGMRWAIGIIEPQGDEALVAKVVALPESHFSLNLAR